MSDIIESSARAALIRAKMRRIRQQLPLNVQYAKREVKQLTDWKFYIKSYPEILLPTIAVAAYLLVPAKRVRKPASSKHDSLAKTANDPVVKSSYLAGVGSVVAGMAIRAITSYATTALTNKLNGFSAVDQNPGPRAGEHNDFTSSRN